MNRSVSQLGPAPALLLGASLLTWGWQCQQLPYALAMAILLESPALLPWRWAISDKEFNTLSDFSGVIFFLAVVYIFSDVGARGIFVILEILPFILFPLLLVQKYSEGGKMKLSALFVSLRKLDPELSPEAKLRTDISLPYFFICLLAASAGNQRTIVFFFIVATLISVALFYYRSRRYSVITWAATLALAMSLAFATQHGLRQLQASIEASFMGIFDQFMWRYRDPKRATTAIGSLGRLKLSDRIVLRVKSKDRIKTPLLLREASYSSFGHGIWNSQESEFVVIDPLEDKKWELDTAAEKQESITISNYMTREEAVIPIPHGITSISEVAAIEIARNQYGAVLMDMREGWVQYDVNYAGRVSTDSPPDEDDLSIINYYRKDFEKLARELGLYEMTDLQKVEAVESFFRENFTYTLNRRQRYPRGRYMANFLFKHRSGHCEYFATATALLLRTVGVPTRYAVGYSIDEYSQLEGQYIARARDAHSWTMVYVEGKWTAVDTTPSIWSPREAENASAFEPILDLWSWLSYRWSMWQSDDLGDEEENNYLIWLLVPLVAILGYRTYYRERVTRKRFGPVERTPANYPGADSSFYKLLALLESSCRPRHIGETVETWIDSLDNITPVSQLFLALNLHNRYRFDPVGVSEAELRQLDELVGGLLNSREDWLKNEGSGVLPTAT